MRQTWGPTALGQFFTRSQPWLLAVDGETFTLKVGERARTGDVLQLDQLDVVPGAFWATVHVPGPDDAVFPLDGIPNARAQHLKEQLAATVAVIHRRHHIAALTKQLAPALDEVVSWKLDSHKACVDRLRRRGWLDRELVDALSASKPTALSALLVEPELEGLLRAQTIEVQEAVRDWRQPFSTTALAINARQRERQLEASAQFLATVDKSPLTKEQAEAVICFDNRVLLVAAAGSGKTATMVAKTGYALKNQYFEPERILLLAFNSDAADELRKRLDARLGPLGLPAHRVAAQTFHAFGLSIIGQATGRKPSVASWLDHGQDLEALLGMVDDLKGSDPDFRTQWDMFRLVFGQDLPEFGKEASNPDSWDRAGNRDGFWTLNNEVVRSRGELVIANWLFYNGIRYVYEAPYQVETATPQHRQYVPDFYLPDADAYLEHWAVNAKGEAPAEFVGYKEGMAWKRQVHADNGTRLLETTMADLWSGQLFSKLESQLTSLGVKLDPNPDRPAPGRQPIESPRLVRTIRAFLTHVKNNRLSMAELRSRLDTGVAGTFRFRHQMFLGLFEKLWERWEERLRAERVIDFEDMLNMATDCLERGQWQSPYELVMVDEFQDASQARARLVAALVSKPGRYLFAVGDDWQSINRFAGADLGVMAEFERHFGKAVTLKLETTFRCPPSLCDITSKFIQKNPRQLRKTVRSPREQVVDPIRIVRVAHEQQTKSAIETVISRLIESHPGAKQSVYLLGRYKRDRTHLPTHYAMDGVDLQFMTVHSAKGLEADHIIIPGLSSETMGFPCRIVDDPVLTLAMPGGDSHDFAEERRLFYVGLTRARKTVTLVTIERKESAFISELIRDHAIKVLNVEGDESNAELCSSCGVGFLVPRKGKWGPFMGCTHYPRCKFTRRLQRS